MLHGSDGFCKYMIISILLVLITLFYACDDQSVSGVYLNQTSVSLHEGDTLRLNAVVAPLDAQDTSVLWTIDNETVATVSEGLITASTAGTAVVTVTTNDGGYTASCEVKVSSGGDAAVTGVSLDNSTLSIAPGATYQLNATVSPDDAADSSVSWVSSNTSIATVSDSGLVTAVTEGIVNITAITTDGGFSASCKVNVSTADVSGVTLNTSSVTLNVDETYQLTADVSPSNAANQNVSWKSSDTSIATVSDTGLVTALYSGDVVISVITEENEYAAGCRVTVSPWSVSINQDLFDYSNCTEFSFSFSNLADSLSYSYSISDTSNNTVSGSGTTSTKNETIGSLDVSSLDAGTLTLAVTINSDVSSDTVTLYKFAGGDGSSGSPYEISNAYELNNVRYFLDSTYYFILTSDIDLSSFVSSGGYFYNDGAGWMPIGDNTDGLDSNKFQGSFNGNSKTISNIMINATMDDVANDAYGFFGYTLGATITDLSLSGGSVTVSASSANSFGIASLIGTADSSTISGCSSNVSVAGLEYAYRVGCLISEFRTASICSDCSATGDVSSATGRIGGFCYLVYGGSTVSGCSSTGVVNCSGSGVYVGGFAGIISGSSSTVEKCFSSGSITASSCDEVGGFCGRLWGYAYIKNSYSRCDLTGNNYVGGFIGWTFSGTSSSTGNGSGSVETTYSYSTGTVSATSYYGGFIGYSISTGEDSSTCYWDTDTSGQFLATSSSSTSGDGATGMATADMISSGNYSGWDFTSTWNIGGSTNDGYPYLR
ncbi:MAG: Ig-like domain-containing protein [Spirochaetales bacterium]|nr:Ig-like domain-containing protein [Spirochaetales bacterium]